MEVFYKGERDKTWEEAGRKSLRQRREFQLKNLDPCETYEVKVVVDHVEIQPPFQVGPFLQSVNQTWAYLENSEENPHFVKNYSSNMSANLNVTSFNTSAIIQTANLCARSVRIVVHPQNCTKDSWQLHVAANSQATVENLKPCTKYNVKIDLYLNSELENSKFNLYLNSNQEEPFEASDFEIPNAGSFYTSPNGNELTDYVNFDPRSKNLSWNFKPFLRQPCASQMEADLELTIGGNTEEGYELQGSRNLNSECDREVILTVNLTKPGSTKQESFVVFRQVVPGNHVKIMEEVLTEDEGQSLRIVADRCLGLPTKIELRPTNQGESIHVPIKKSTKGSSNTDLLLPLKELTSVQWATCADYQVREQFANCFFSI